MNLLKHTILIVTLSSLMTFSSLTSGADYIEFWVVADWTQSPGYHPVILSNDEDTLPHYQISKTATRDALLVQIGGQYGQFDFDFSDGRTHHVALLNYDDKIAALIDGRFAGVVALSIEPGKTPSFFIAPADGGRSSF